MHSRLAVVSAFALMAAPTGSPAQSPGSIESELNYAREYLDAGKPDYAKWRYESVLRRDPNNAEARAGLAKAEAADAARKVRRAGCTEIKMPWATEDPCAGKGPSGGAAAELSKVDEVAPQQQPSVVAAGGADVQDEVRQAPAEGDIEAVFQGFEASIEADPELRHAKGEMSQGNRSAAIERLKAYTAARPDSAEAWFMLALAYARTAQDEAGFAALKRAVELKPTFSLMLNQPAAQEAQTDQAPAPAPKPPSDTAATAGGPPVGSYFCTYGVNRGQVLGPGRNFQILPGGQYAADDGDRGTYSYDGGSRKITFRGGFFGRMNAYGDFIGGRLSQIDINPEGGLLTYCSLQ